MKRDTAVYLDRRLRQEMHEHRIRLERLEVLEFRVKLLTLLLAAGFVLWVAYL